MTTLEVVKGRASRAPPQTQPPLLHRLDCLQKFDCVIEATVGGCRSNQRNDGCGSRRAVGLGFGTARLLDRLFLRLDRLLALWTSGRPCPNRRVAMRTLLHSPPEFDCGLRGFRSLFSSTAVVCVTSSSPSKTGIAAAPVGFFVFLGIGAYPGSGLVIATRGNSNGNYVRQQVGGVRGNGDTRTKAGGLSVHAAAGPSLPLGI